MGLLIKIILHYEESHWRLASCSGEVVSSAGPVCIRSVSECKYSRMIRISSLVLMTLTLIIRLLWPSSEDPRPSGSQISLRRRWWPKWSPTWPPCWAPGSASTRTSRSRTGPRRNGLEVSEQLRRVNLSFLFDVFIIFRSPQRHTPARDSWLMACSQRSSWQVKYKLTANKNIRFWIWWLYSSILKEH